MSDQAVTVTKASGEQVPFEEDKLRNSLRKAGADATVIENIITEIRDQLYDGISTKVIYRKAFSMLKRRSSPLAARYKLKKAIMELGPSGYPFENYVGEIMKHQGFQVKVGEIVLGNCVNHEVDVIATKDHEMVMVECKFKTSSGNKADVKVPLYIQARFEDIKRKWESIYGDSKQYAGWVITNNKFTSDAIKYGKCVNLNLISWDYPQKGSLKELVDTANLHPVTCLTTLTKFEKKQLLDSGKVLC